MKNNYIKYLSALLCLWPLIYYLMTMMRELGFINGLISTFLWSIVCIFIYTIPYLVIILFIIFGSYKMIWLNFSVSLCFSLLVIYCFYYNVFPADSKNIWITSISIWCISIFSLVGNLFKVK